MSVLKVCYCNLLQYRTLKSPSKTNYLCNDMKRYPCTFVCHDLAYHYHIFYFYVFIYFFCSVGKQFWQIFSQTPQKTLVANTDPPKESGMNHNEVA